MPFNISFIPAPGDSFSKQHSDQHFYVLMSAGGAAAMCTRERGGATKMLGVIASNKMSRSALKILDQVSDIFIP